VEVLRSRLRDAVAVEGTRIEDGVAVSAGARNGVYRIFGVRPPWADVRKFGADRGDFITDADVESRARVCVIGQTVARQLFGTAEPIGAEVLINQVPFRVEGVLVAKGASPAEGDRDARIVIPITTFYERLYRRLFLDQIVVQARESSSATLSRLGRQIRDVLREQHRLTDGDDFVVRLPDTIAQEARGLSRSLFFLLLGLSGIGAAVAVLVIGLVTQQSVKARQGEIGIRRATGALPADIVQQIVAEGAAVSAIGGILGVIVGLPAAWLLARSQQLEVGFSAAAVLGPLLLVTLAAMAGVIPAKAAARLDPAAALRS
jgi:putative ABC transport system permease protein